jgi:hypothetical protein
MADELTTSSEVKTSSDGMVKITVEKYNELLETIADQKNSASRLNDRLQKALNEPPVVNRTTVIKTDEMVAGENRMWGGTLMGVGASMFVIGAFRYKAGLS